MANEGQPRIGRRTLLTRGLEATVGGAAAAVYLSQPGLARAGGGPIPPLDGLRREVLDIDPAILDELKKMAQERIDRTAAKEAFAALREPTFTGFPESVDPGVVDVARTDRGFTNTIAPARAFLAEPGALLVGPDFGDDSGKNPYTKKGVEPKGWVAMYESRGHIKPFSPGNTEVMHGEEPFHQDLPEGGFNLYSLGHGTFVFGDNNQYRIDLPQIPNNNYLVVIRGYYGDNQQNTDRNDTVIVTNYKAGHAQAFMYEAGNETNSAFISEEQFKQILETSHSGGTNLGDGGAGRATIVFADANTGAWDVMEQVESRFKGGQTPVELLRSNWQK